MDGDLRLFTVVGVVGDVREDGLDAAPQPTFYGNYRQRPAVTSSFAYVIQGEGHVQSLAAAARAVLHEVDPEVPPRIRTLVEIRSASLADRRFNLGLLGAFGLSALVLAGLGLYGVTSYAVARRTREIGVRMALGAQPSRVLALVVADGLRPVLAGAAVGILLALALGRLLRSLLFGVGPADPLSIGLAAFVLGASALLAALLPARRAARVDPLIALRAE
jgi:ABC-type antimicrobial peptide transport system permease subunit